MMGQLSSSDCQTSLVDGPEIVSSKHRGVKLYLYGYIAAKTFQWTAFSAGS
jgi:hypothetical protein